MSIQVRCISLLCLPMYCGKAGRGILKAVVLTYVVAGKDIKLNIFEGKNLIITRLYLIKQYLLHTIFTVILICVFHVTGPITNMGLNAKEVVRVFSCTTRLSHNLSKFNYVQSYRPLNKALMDFNGEIIQIVESIRFLYFNTSINHIWLKRIPPCFIYLFKTISDS